MSPELQNVVNEIRRTIASSQDRTYEIRLHPNSVTEIENEGLAQATIVSSGFRSGNYTGGDLGRGSGLVYNRTLMGQRLVIDSSVEPGSYLMVETGRRRLSRTENIGVIVERAIPHILRMTDEQIRVRQVGGVSVFPIYGESGGLTTECLCYLETNNSQRITLAEIRFTLADEESSIRGKISDAILDALEQLHTLRGEPIPDRLRGRERNRDAEPRVVSNRGFRIPLQVGRPGAVIPLQQHPETLTPMPSASIEEIEKAIEFLRENPDFFSSRNDRPIKGRRIKLERSNRDSKASSE